ncbi:MAG: hypothetical protein Q8S21_04320 [Candidatus Paracaedibacteraceae bacterium]|nr:hypothetical protein [Candidatus Paracaedibacteraceae bacterium]
MIKNTLLLIIIFATLLNAKEAPLAASSSATKGDLNEETTCDDDYISQHAAAILRHDHSGINPNYTFIESKRLSIKFINNLNFSNPKRLQQITKILMLRGIHSENPIKKVLKAYRFYLIDGIKACGIDELHFDSEIKENIEKALKFISNEGFEIYIKPEMKKLENQALHIQQGLEYELYLEQDTETDDEDTEGYNENKGEENKPNIETDSKDD